MSGEENTDPTYASRAEHVSLHGHVLATTALEGITLPTPESISSFLEIYEKFYAEKFRFTEQEVAEIFDEVVSTQSRLARGSPDGSVPVDSHASTFATAFQIPPSRPVGKPLFVAKLLAMLDKSEEDTRTGAAPGATAGEEDYGGVGGPPPAKKCRTTAPRPFFLAFYHMPQRVHWRCPTPRDETGERTFAGDVVMQLHAIAARAKVEALVAMACSHATVSRGTPDLVPLIFAGDWNTKPSEPGYRFLVGTGAAMWSRASSSQNSTNTKKPPAPAVLLAHLLFKNTPLERGLLGGGSELRSAYVDVHGAPAELTTRTQEFQGPIDHVFVSKAVKVDRYNPMPTAKGLKAAQIWHPNMRDEHSGEEAARARGVRVEDVPAEFFEVEPSDHLMQRLALRV